MSIAKVRYLSSGLTGRWGTPRTCPACGGVPEAAVDRKYFHSLLQCRNCGLTYRYPGESTEDATRFYQGDYVQEGLTTDLPDGATLKALLDNRFKGSEKDFSEPIALLSALGVRPGMRVLDYGANWGYGTLQMRDHGFDATAFEISKPRAAFGTNIGVAVHTSLDKVGGGFDAVYSSHVLEHIPNPLASLQEQLALIKPGGLVVAHTPNGSADRRQRHKAAYRANWGFIHPVMLTERFVAKVADGRPHLVATRHELALANTWDRKGVAVGALDGPNLFFAIRGRE